MVDELNNEFRLLEIIGEGGLCYIWKIQAKESNEIFAFKELKDLSPTNLQAVIDEYSFLKYHQHPGIVKAHLLIRSENRTGIIMDYLPGPTLEAECGKLGEEKLPVKVIEVLETANFVHHCGYIYNDYKPQNFVYDKNGRLKLIDFNLVRPETDVTGIKSGTFGYLAPELLTGKPPSSQSDIYSLGATLFELATGDMPFRAPDETALIKMITETIPDMPRTPNDVLNRTIMKMLSVSLADRPANPFEVAITLGLEEEFRLLVRSNYQYYLKAGIWPYSGEFIDSLAEREKLDHPLTAASADCREHERFFKKAASLINSPNRTEGYLNHLLKKYQAPDDFPEKMRSLSNGDPEIIGWYVNHLIKSGYFKFGQQGWQATAEFDDSLLPNEMIIEYGDRLSRLPEISKILLNWLAVLDCAIEIGFLTRLTGLDADEVRREMKSLAIGNWVRIENGLYSIPARAETIAIYENIAPETRQSLHEQAAELYRILDPSKIANLARHYFAARKYPSALKYNYQTALKWYKEFDFKKAGEFIEIAEVAILKIEQDKQSAQIFIDTYMLAADIAKALADNTSAETKYLRAIALAEESDCPASLAKAYKNLGDLYRLQQKSEESIKYSTAALELYKQADDLPCQAACLNNLGLAYWISGNYDLALDYFEKALKLNKGLGNLLEQSKINNNIGIIYDITGKSSQVMERFQDALECAVKIGNPELEAKISGNIGFFFLNSGKPHQSLDYLSKGYEIAKRIGNDNEQLNIISNIALAYHKTGNFIRSAEANQSTFEIAATLKHDMFQAQSSHLLAKDCIAMGNYRLASEMLARADRICSGLSNPELLVDVIHTSIELELAVGDTSACRRLFDRLNRQQSFTHKQKLKTELLQAGLALLLDDPDGPEKAAALSEHRENSDFIEITGRAALARAKYLLDANQLDEASSLLHGFPDLDIKNTIINFEFDLVFAEYYLKKNKFDESLELTKKVRREASNSGCVPTLFKAVVLEARIFTDCRKEAQAAKVLDQAANILKALTGAFPEKKNIQLFYELPVIKKYRELSDRISKKFGSVLLSRPK